MDGVDSIDVDLSGWTLVVPSVCPAAVGQLAVPAAQPGVASCTTGLELFTAPGQQLAFLQVRNKVVAGRATSFCRRLAAWAKARGAARVLVLSSAAGHTQVEEDLDSASRVRVFPPDVVKGFAPGSVAAVDPAALRGAGLMVPLMEAAAGAGLAVAAAVCYADEGVNLDAARAVLEAGWAVAKLLGAGVSALGLDFKEPPAKSWALMYAAAAPPAIFFN